mmetsp:Transcript_26961/g.63059  ORF Transcript_26961/g.63059 Transcript_26961/m.63059 type:complete len:180 (-) Transcript_26961:14-553(-)
MHSTCILHAFYCDGFLCWAASKVTVRRNDGERVEQGEELLVPMLVRNYQCARFVRGDPKESAHVDPQTFFHSFIEESDGREGPPGTTALHCTAQACAVPPFSTSFEMGGGEGRITIRDDIVSPEMASFEEPTQNPMGWFETFVQCWFSFFQIADWISESSLVSTVVTSRWVVPDFLFGS